MYMLVNFDSYKLNVSNPDFLNICLVLLIIILSTISLTKRNRSFSFLDFSHTNQLRGIGMLLIIMGHIWYHISNSMPLFTFSGPAVSLFFILSGFGLTRSFYKNEKINFVGFILPRIKRIFIPYWITTFIIIIADIYLKGITYEINDVFLTIFGVNLKGNIISIDYVRWYVTLLLIWYIVFYFGFKMLNSYSWFGILIFASIIFYLNETVFGLIWYQIFSFPIGVLLGVYYNQISVLAKRLGMWVHFLLLFVMVLGLLSGKLFLEPIVESNIVLQLIREIEGVLFSLSLVIILYIVNNVIGEVRFLSYIGIYSYELFLLHGALFIKYNFFTNLFSYGNWGFILGVSLCFIITLLTAILLNRLSNKILNCTK
jgi:peptidoglycan/LPS O-acetylase OafA/YrhL